MSSVAFHQPRLTEEHLSTHEVKNENPLSIVAIKNTAWSFDNLAVARQSHFRQAGAAVGMLIKLSDMLEDFPNQIACRLRVIQSDVIGNGIEVV